MDTKKVKAWGVHVFTATGVIFAMLAMFAVINLDAEKALIWLGIALLIDGFDGTLARHYDVKELAPQFDGAILDMIIDYLTYVFVPAFFIYQFIPLPDGSAKMVSVLLILLSSFFCFCNVNMKSKDNYFVGFPATWNIVAFSFVVVDSPAILNFITIIALSVLSLAPIKFLHPFRVKKAMAVNVLATMIWLVSSALLIVHYGEEYNLFVLIAWWISGIYFLGFGLIQTLFNAYNH